MPAAVIRSSPLVVARGGATELTASCGKGGDTEFAGERGKDGVTERAVGCGNGVDIDDGGPGGNCSDDGSGTGAGLVSGSGTMAETNSLGPVREVPAGGGRFAGRDGACNPLPRAAEARAIQSRTGRSFGRSARPPSAITATIARAMLAERATRRVVVRFLSSISMLARVTMDAFTRSSSVEYAPSSARSHRMLMRRGIPPVSRYTLRIAPLVKSSCSHPAIDNRWRM